VIMPNKISITTDSRITRYPPAGRCIYCGATRYSGAEVRPLGDEHIIAEGLSGTLILPRASCRRCEKQTAKIEVNVLRGILWAPRTVMRLRTKRPKERPTSFPTMAQIGGQDVKINLPIEDYPTMLFFPRVGPPGILVGRPRDQADMRQMWMYKMNLNAHSFAKYGIQSMASAVMDVQRVSQMFAKIAHCYATACYGIDGFTPLLLDHILGDGKFPYHFLGGTDDERSAGNVLHELSDELIEANGTVYLLARIRLFANLGAPTYVVVTGHRDKRP
jgi:hypothetical protein